MEYIPIPADAQLGLLATLASIRIATVIGRHLRPLHLTPLQYHALYALCQSDRWLRQQDLNRVLHVKNKRLRNALVILSDRNLIKRVVPPGICRSCDRAACEQCTSLRITDFGCGILKAADILVAGAHRELAAGFVPSEYQSGLLFLYELSDIELDSRRVTHPKLLTLTPRRVCPTG